MIELDFVVLDGRDLDDDRLAAAAPSVLHYDLFLGDVVFRIGDLDMSGRWWWVPVLDFAMCLDSIARSLGERPGHPERFEFTESDAGIGFRRSDDVVTVTPDYVEGTARVPFADLRHATDRFLQRVVRELGDAHPGLWRNPYIAERLGRRCDTFILVPPCTDAMVRALLAMSDFAGSPEAADLGPEPVEAPGLVLSACVRLARRLLEGSQDPAIPGPVAGLLDIVESVVASGDPTCVNVVWVDLFEVLDPTDQADRRMAAAFGPHTRQAHEEWQRRIYLHEAAWAHPRHPNTKPD